MTLVAANIPATTKEKAIERVATEYGSQGYRVILDPRAAELPPFLAPFAMDVVAFGAAESVVIQVREHAALRDPILPLVAQAVHGRPGWRMELVVCDEARSVYDAEPADPIAPEIADGFFALAEEALNRVQIEAAMLLGWAATESALRLLAQRYEVVLEDKSPSLLVRQLVADGVVDQKRARTFLDALSLRHRLAHGVHRTADSDLSRALLHAGREVLAEALPGGRK